MARHPARDAETEYIIVWAWAVNSKPIWGLYNVIYLVFNAAVNSLKEQHTHKIRSKKLVWSESLNSQWYRSTESGP